MTNTVLSFRRGDVVRLSPEAIDRGISPRSPKGRLGLVIGHSRCKRYVSVKWGNNVTAYRYHPDFLCMALTHL